jgi:hypothetical protein
MAMIRKTLLALALSAGLAGAVAAHGHDRMDLCDVDSDYDLKLSERAITFSREDGSPRVVEMSTGRLTVDGVEMTLTAEDRARIADFEASVREIVPEVKAIAFEAIQIAFDAVEQVARAFVSEKEITRTAERMRESRIAIERELEGAFEDNAWSERDFERIVEHSMKSIVPLIIGDVVGNAISIALTGDETAAAELEARVEKMEAAIERDVENRADDLERRADALCPVVADLDRIESELTVRLADNSKLDLVELD